MQSLRLTIVTTISLTLVFFAFHNQSKLLASSGAVFVQQQFGRLITKAGFGLLREDAMLVVGDVMLGRDVEKMIEAHGLLYPFKHIKDELRTAVVLGNFEAAVPKFHVLTPALGMVLSVDKQNLESLSRSGFTHFSLANNHSYDFGSEGFADSKDALALYGFKIFGEPQNVSNDSVSYVDINGLAVAIIAINAVSGYPSLSEWKPILETAERGSAMQMVYIHWGEEYQNRHNNAQEKFAHGLVDAGVDIVVGHHPHVVQDIETYKEALIFYSLGNFVFDQYFDDEVQVGLMLRLKLDEGTGEVELLPVDSRASKASPQLMNEGGRSSFLEELSRKSSFSLKEALEMGELEFSF